MGKLFSTTIIVSGVVSLLVYFMFVAPMLTKSGTTEVVADPVK